MNSRFAKIASSLALAVFAASMSFAQPALPRIGFVYPAGGQVGTTVTITVGGQNLNGASAALVSGAGIETRVVGYERPLTQKEINDLREEEQRLQEKRTAARTDSTKPPFSAADEKRAGEIRQVLATRGNRQATPAVAESVTLAITLAADSPPGDRELRIRTPGGLSNPLPFYVGQLHETTSPGVTATSARVTRREPPVDITLPAHINGQILPGEADRFRFTAKRGQHLVFAASARALMPYLADAVPGWFQATLAVFDAQGRELAYADDYRFAPDPVLACEIPADGDYTVEIKDALFRGREDFVYRIAAGELPFITSVFPLGGKVGGRTQVELAGWNLPARELAIDAGARKPGSFLLSVIQQGTVSNPVRFALASGPECQSAAEGGPQPLSLPTTVNGRIDRPGHEDVFRFTACAGEAFTAEVFARRLGSPLDSVLTLVDETGRQLATNDDTEDKGAGLLTHHADSRIAFVAPVDGSYSLRIADAQRRGGPEYGYRLRIGPPQPDFELRVVPSSINVRAGGTAAVTVHALRRDGFDGDVAIGLRSIPGNFVLSGARIPGNQDRITLTLTAPFNTREDVFNAEFVGVAKIGGREVSHAATPADDLMQAFAYHHLVPAKEQKICVSGRGTTLRPLGRPPVQLTVGRATHVRFSLPPTTIRALTSVQAELVGAPEGIKVTRSSLGADHIDIELACDGAKAAPGLRGNLLFQVFGERRGGKGGGKTAGPRSSLGAVPAIPFEVPAAKS